MKSLLVSSIAMLIVSLGGHQSLAEDFKPAVLVQQPEQVFAPMGFDDNDNAQIVLYANLPGTCHKAGTARYRVDKQKKMIYIRNEIYYYAGGWCAQVMIPYLQTVNVGILRSGDYGIALEKEDGNFEVMSHMPVATARTASPDDYLYAPVEEAHFTRIMTAEPRLILSGHFKNTCMKMSDVKVNYRPNHVIEVLPIASMDPEGCEYGSRPFEVSVKISMEVHGRALIHVRSLNGQALNQVVDL